MSGWSDAIVDLDNDGWKDLYVARSNVIDNVALFTQRQYGEPNSVFRNLGTGKFQDVTSSTGPGFQTPQSIGARHSATWITTAAWTWW